MIKLATPRNMENTVDEHVGKTGRPITYLKGRNISRIETFGEDYDIVMRLRSGDIPVKVRDICDVGIVGRDWLEEKKLELGLRLVVLDEYVYGREFFTDPRLEFVVSEDERADSAALLAPGIVSGEYPALMKKYLEEHGWEDRVVQLGVNGAPKDPKEFRRFCIEKGFMGLDIVHGTISELINAGAGYGFMVSETNGTKVDNGIKTLDVVIDAHPLLIADPDALNDERLRPAIYQLRDDLRSVYELHFDPEVHKRAVESSVPLFLHKEG